MFVHCGNFILDDMIILISIDHSERSEKSEWRESVSGNMF